MASQQVALVNSIKTGSSRKQERKEYKVIYKIYKRIVTLGKGFIMIK